jgi:hypothetical protein
MKPGRNVSGLMAALAMMELAAGGVALADDPYGKHTEHPENAMYSIQVYDIPNDD